MGATSNGKGGKLRRQFLEKVASVADVAMSPFALLALPAVAFSGRLSWRAPIVRGIFEKAQATVVRHHYYNPVVYPSDLITELDAPRDLPGVDIRSDAQRALLQQIAYTDEIEPGGKPQFDYDNPNFARNDTVVLYGMLRHLKPRRVIEVGSGFSTLVIGAALKRNGNGPEHSCIEPYEMPWLEGTGVRVIRERVERLDPAPFLALESGDVLFIDSSHIIRPQGDVLHLFLTVLPQLKPGVIVHIHDVYTPYDYHPYLVIKERKMWNEQYLLEALLSGGDRFEVLFGTYWASRALSDDFERLAPGFREPPVRDGCSFWIRRI